MSVKLLKIMLSLILGCGLAVPVALAQDQTASNGLPDSSASGVESAVNAKSDAPFTGENHKLARLELKQVKVVDAIQMVSEITGLNVVATSDAAEREISLLIQNVTAAQAIEIVCKVAGLWYNRDEDTQAYRVMTTEEFQKDHIVYMKDEIKIFTLQHPNAVTVAVAIEDLFGERVSMSLGIDENELDAMTGMSGNQMGGTFGGGFGNSGFGSGYGSGYGYGSGSGYGGGRFSRSGGYYGGSGGRYSRGVGYGSRGFGGSRSGTGRQVDSPEVLEETLTSDQLSRLQRQLGGDWSDASAELAGMTRKEMPIYVTVNQQHNLIVVRTSDSQVMKKIERLVNELDRPTPQVLLEMKILELNVGDSFRSIFDFEVMSGDDTSGTASSQPVNPLDVNAATSPSHVFGSGNFALEGGRMVYQFLDDQIRARMQLLARDQRIEVVSTPILLASNNRPAQMFVGEERVLTTGARTDSTTTDGVTSTFIEPVTEVRDVGNTLIVTPKINADRTVTLFISQDSSSVLPDSTTIPIGASEGTITEFPIDTINTATLAATVVAKDGMTLAIGGLIRIETTDTEEKVPFLGDIPLLGLLFKRTIKQRTKTELILLITPRVLFTPAEAEKIAEERVEALSRSSYLEAGDEGLDALFDDVDERLKKRSGLNFLDEDYDPEAEEDDNQINENDEEQE